MKPSQLNVQTIDYCQHIGLNPIRFAKWQAFIKTQLKRINHKKTLKA